MTAHASGPHAERPALSPRQRQVLDFIVHRIETFGYPPTIREICSHFAISSTNGVADHLKALTRKGYLTHQECKSRTLRPVADAHPPERLPTTRTPTLVRHGRAAQPSTSARSQLSVVPMLGRVAAGLPILATEDARPEDNVLVDPSWLGSGADVFALQVCGDSMVEDGILDGDTVFVRRQETAVSGETVVVLIDNEATLKRYFPEGKRVRLQPANASMKPIYLLPSQAQRVRILGTVVGVWRKMNR